MFNREDILIKIEELGYKEVKKKILENIMMNKEGNFNDIFSINVNDLHMKTNVSEANIRAEIRELMFCNVISLVEEEYATTRRKFKLLPLCNWEMRLSRTAKKDSTYLFRRSIKEKVNNTKFTHQQKLVVSFIYRKTLKINSSYCELNVQELERKGYGIQRNLYRAVEFLIRKRIIIVLSQTHSTSPKIVRFNSVSKWEV